MEVSCLRLNEFGKASTRRHREAETDRTDSRYGSKHGVDPITRLGGSLSAFAIIQSGELAPCQLRS